MFSYGLAGALALKGDIDGAKAALAESLKLKPEVNLAGTMVRVSALDQQK